MKLSSEMQMNGMGQRSLDRYGILMRATGSSVSSNESDTGSAPGRMVKVCKYPIMV